MATFSGALQALISLVTAGATQNEDDMRHITRQTASWKNEAAVAGTTAIAERVVTRARQKSRLTKLVLITPTATTANATNLLTVIVRKRTLALPGTQVAVITFAMDTPTTDDLVAFTEKDLLASYADGAVGAFDFEKGDMVTVEVTKTGGSGLAFPIADIELQLEPRAA